MLIQDENHFMRQALRQAELAAEAGEVPDYLLQVGVSVSLSVGFGNF